MESNLGCRFGMMLRNALLSMVTLYCLPVSYALAEVVDVDRELMIRDLSVVNDPVRTEYVPLNSGAENASTWTFGRLIENMAGEHDPQEFVLNWLSHWETDQNINGFTVVARPTVRSLVIDPWIIRSGGTPGSNEMLDFSKAPFRLLAIVNRTDLVGTKNTTKESIAGEGRFVFGVLSSDTSGHLTGQLEFTVIFEYGLPAETQEEARRWIHNWHALGNMAFGEDYSAALQSLTDEFTGKNVAPDKPNGSALNQIRTNEIALASPWEMREFVISTTTGLLTQKTVSRTPDKSFNNTQQLVDFINQNEQAILEDNHVVPENMLGGSALVDFNWNAPGVNEEARHKLALSTCNGCHLSETATAFLHVSPRNANQMSALSSFLTSEELLRRNDLMMTRLEDFDIDGIADIQDNCVVIANADQRDADNDGYGSICDADLNNDHIVNSEDLAIFQRLFGSNDPIADLNGDGVVNVPDFAILRNQFFNAPGPSQPDTDGDGIPDRSDNCTLVANNDQRDTDNDGFGNICDPDLNNDLIINAADLALFRELFGTSDENADFNGDGIVNILDYGILSANFFGVPGPSGLNQ